MIDLALRTSAASLLSLGNILIFPIPCAITCVDGVVSTVFLVVHDNILISWEKYVCFRVAAVKNIRFAIIESHHVDHLELILFTGKGSICTDSGFAKSCVGHFTFSRTLKSLLHFLFCSVYSKVTKELNNIISM